MLFSAVNCTVPLQSLGSTNCELIPDEPPCYVIFLGCPKTRYRLISPRLGRVTGRRREGARGELRSDKVSGLYSWYIYCTLSLYSLVRFSLQGLLWNTVLTGDPCDKSSDLLGMCQVWVRLIFIGARWGLRNRVFRNRGPCAKGCAIGCRVQTN